MIPGFISRHNLCKLLYFEVCESMLIALIRVKHIKDMKEADKLKMIKSVNPELIELYSNIAY